MPLEQIVDLYTGISSENMIKDLISRFGAKLPRDFAAVLGAHTQKEFDSELRPMNGLPEILATIPYPMCVASSSERERIIHSLSITGLLTFFNGNLFSATQVARSKPAPDLFLFAARSMSIPAENCLVVEDSVPGIMAARTAQMYVFGFTGGSHCRSGHGDKLSEAGAMRTFARMIELPRMLADLHNGASR
jgi:HAD superfamily hydrolase (TIGR01509 family)